MNLNLFKFLLSLFKRKLVENTTEKSITIRFFVALDEFCSSENGVGCIIP